MRLVHDPGLDALQPFVPPAQGFLEEADLRTRLAEMRIFMRPGTDQPLLRAGQMLEHPGNRVGIAVGPAAHEIDRTGDRVPILADRAMLPKIVAPLMLQPIGDQQGLVLQAVQPGLAPGIAEQRLVGGARHIGQHDRGPMEIVVQQRPAHEMDIVVVAVVGRAEGDHRLQLRRTAGGDLQAVEAAPGDPDHADTPGAPGLGRDPGHDLEAIVLLLLQIFVLQQPVGFAGAAHVDAKAGIAIAGEIGMGEMIALRRAVALAIGQIFQDRGNRLLLRIGRQPDARRQAAAVRERDKQILDLPHLARKLRDDIHGGSVLLRMLEGRWRRSYAEPSTPFNCRHAGAQKI